MARQPKPWYRKDRKVWCVTINGQRKNLGPDKKGAFRRFYEIMRQPLRVRVVSGDGLLSVIDSFLEWNYQNRALATYNWYREHLQNFARHYPDLPIEQLLPYHVENWAAINCSNVNTRRNRMRAVKRCVRWAVAQGLLERDPLAAIEIPSAQPREVYVSPSEFDGLLSYVRSPEFGDLLRVTYEIGCRPQESLRVEARHLDEQHSRWVFPRSEAKGKRMPRVVYLSDYALEVSARLAKAHPLGQLFRNSKGTPWNGYSVSCMFERIQLRMGKVEVERQGQSPDCEAITKLSKKLKSDRVIQGCVVTKSEGDLHAEARRKLLAQKARQLAPRYSLYALRHSWATNALQSGIDSLTVAILMGHTNPSQLACTYQHLSHNPEHLLAQARQVKGQGA